MKRDEIADVAPLMGFVVQYKPAVGRQSVWSVVAFEVGGRYYAVGEVESQLRPKGRLVLMRQALSEVTALERLREEIKGTFVGLTGEG